MQEGLSSVPAHGLGDTQVETAVLVGLITPAQDERKVVRIKTYTTRPMHVEDAIMQMDLLGHSFYVFINIETDQTNVLYLRKDGNLGLLEPEA